MKEYVFEALTEGGSLTIERIKDGLGEKFLYHKNEYDPIEDIPIDDVVKTFNTFEEAFQVIHSKYLWYNFTLKTIHLDYRDYILAELIKILDSRGILPTDLRNTVEDLKRTLNIQLKYGVKDIYPNNYPIGQQTSTTPSVKGWYFIIDAYD